MKKFIAQYFFIPLISINIIFSSCTQDLLIVSEEKTLETQSLTNPFLPSLIPKDWKLIAFKADLDVNLIDTKSVVEIQNGVYNEFEFVTLKKLQKKSVPIFINGLESIQSTSQIHGYESNQDGLLFLHDNPEDGYVIDVFENSKISMSYPNLKDNHHPLIKDMQDNEKKSLLNSLKSCGTQYSNMTMTDIEEIWKSKRDSVQTAMTEDFNAKSKSQKLKGDLVLDHDTNENGIKLRVSEVLKRHENLNSQSHKSLEMEKSVPVDLRDYRLKTYVYSTTTSISSMWSKDVWARYRTFVQVYEGRYEGTSDYRIFLSCYLKANPGSNVVAQVRGNKVFNLLEKLELYIKNPQGFDNDEWGPENNSGGQGSYSNSQSQGIKLKALKPLEALEITFSGGNRYSYSFPDYYFTTQFSNQKHTWKWEPGNCCYGAYNKARGLFKGYGAPWDTYHCGIQSLPIAMRQLNKNEVNTIASRPSNQTAKKIELRFGINVRTRNVFGKCYPWLFGLYGNISVFDYISPEWGTHQAKSFSTVWVED